MNVYEVFRKSRKAILILFDRRKIGELLFERFPPKIALHFYDIDARYVRAPLVRETRALRTRTAPQDRARPIRTRAAYCDAAC